MNRAVFWYDGRHRNDGPPLFLRQAALRNKEELGLSEADHKIPLADFGRWGKYDLNIWVDFGEDGLGENYIKCPGTNKVYWCSDSHLGMDYRLEKAKEFDWVFVSIPRHIDRFKDAVGHDRVYWLPHAAEPTCYTKIDTVKKYDVCFVGHLPNGERIEYLDALFDAFPDFYYGQKFFEEANRKYNESKIVFNHAIDREANMRVFEASLSGSLQLCSYGEDIERLGFKDGENIVFYNSIEDMLEKAKYYLRHEEEAARISEAGRVHVLNNHTYLHRIKKILEVVRGGTENGKGA